MTKGKTNSFILNQRDNSQKFLKNSDTFGAVVRLYIWSRTKLGVKPIEKAVRPCHYPPPEGRFPQHRPFLLINCRKKLSYTAVRIPLTKYGWPQVAVFPAVIIAAMAICLLAGISSLPAWATVSIEVLLAIILIWVLAFFRDPHRYCPSDKNLLLAPADGKITDIEIVNEGNFIGADAIRIGIFLSIFDVHINRAPCNAKVEKITYRKGKYKNAANPHSGRVNESNDLYLVRTDSPEDKLVVRQISGAIARRIICEKTEGQKLTGGEKFGMIKFGSRTELYVPTRQNAKCLAKIGDKVKAGLTPIVKYEW